MPGISENASRRLRRAFFAYGLFDSHEELADFFRRHDCLHAWSAIPRREDKELRIVAFIAFLLDKYCPGTGKNALLAFLHILREETRVPQQQEELATLSKELTPVLNNAGSSGKEQSFIDETDTEGSSSVYVGADEKFVRLAEAVGKVTVRQIKRHGATPKYFTGTGWLVAPKLALTCYHVIEARGPEDGEEGGKIESTDLMEQARNAIITFGYSAPAKGVDYTVSTLECFDPTLDYALLRLEDRSGDPLPHRAYIWLDPGAPITQSTRLGIIQHPRGHPKQYAWGDYIKEKATDPSRIYHNVQTDYGTSGAPVLNGTNLKAVAMHTGKVNGARPEATRIQAILEDIKERRPGLYDEIKQSQPEGGL